MLKRLLDCPAAVDMRIYIMYRVDEKDPDHDYHQQFKIGFTNTVYINDDRFLSTEISCDKCYREHNKNSYQNAV